MPHQRDPVSQTMDRAARLLLSRAYRANGGWAATRLADPSLAQLARWAMYGIDVRGPDPVRSLPGKGVDARDRWGRAFVRALYYQHRWYSGRPGGGWRQVQRAAARSGSAIEVEVGRHLPGGAQAGTLLVAGRPVRVRVRRGGEAAMRAVRKLDDSERIWTGSGEPGDRWADPSIRDWAG